MTRRLLALAAAAILSGADPVSAGVRIVAPRDGAVMGEGRLTVIGIADAADAPRVLIDGTAVGVSLLSGGAFTAALDVPPGSHKVVAKAGADTDAVGIERRGPGAGEAAYRYHPPAAEGDCKACHPVAGVWKSGGPDQPACGACHDRKDTAKFLHGPVAAGACAVCHDPHGSAQKAFLAAEERALCKSCHDQSRTRDHMERSTQRRCRECHDPHGSAKSYMLY